MSDKLFSTVLFLVSCLFTQKLNAIGIANLPMVIRTFQETDKKQWYKYAVGLFQSSVVISGLLNRWPILIKVNAGWNIGLAVKESIDARKERESTEKSSNDHHADRKSLSRYVKDFFFFGTSKAQQEGDKPADEDKNLTKTQQTLKKAKSILSGKRDSAIDDIIWGVLQVSFVFFNQSNLQAIGHAWMVFLLTILDEAVFNPRLDSNQKMKQVAWVSFVGYMSGKLIY